MFKVCRKVVDMMCLFRFDLDNGIELMLQRGCLYEIFAFLFYFLGYNAIFPNIPF